MLDKSSASNSKGKCVTDRKKGRECKRENLRYFENAS